MNIYISLLLNNLLMLSCAHLATLNILGVQISRQRSSPTLPINTSKTILISKGLSQVSGRTTSVNICNGSRQIFIAVLVWV